MVSETRRAWEDALDVCLYLRDWGKIEEIRNRLKRERVESLAVTSF